MLPVPPRSALRSLGTLALASLPLACGDAELDREPASAVLITMDTTRADALGCYGRTESVTPNLDRLAHESVVFDGAYTVAPITLPSHASMMTGLYPLRHTVRDNGMQAVPRSSRTLAERARSAGVQTAAFVAAAVLDPSFGLDQGFERYDAPSGPGGQAAERPAREVVDRALDWLAQRDPERPLFLWVHLFDPHAPYRPPDPFRVGIGESVPYLGEVASMDHELGRLFGALEDEGLLESATLLVVADHGEAFGEHDEYSHGVYCYEPTLRVPLILRYPDGRRAGERSPQVASVVDVFPTLAQAMGLPAEASMPEIDGRSLLLEEPPADRGVYFESYNGFLYYGWSPISGWLDARGKYLHSSRPQFFDPRADPGETLDLVQERAGELTSYRDAIEHLSRLPALVRDEASGVDEDLLVDIRNLGYAGAGEADEEEELPRPLAQSLRPAPSRTAPWHRKLMQAAVEVNRREWARAATLYQEVLGEDPGNYHARKALGTCLVELRRFEDAILVFEQLLRDGRRGPSTYYYLGVAHMQSGRETEAIDAFRSAHELSPEKAPILQLLVQLLEREGRTGEAARYRTRLAELAAGGQATPDRQR